MAEFYLFIFEKNVYIVKDQGSASQNNLLRSWIYLIVSILLEEYSYIPEQ